MNNPQNNLILSALPEKEYQRFSIHLKSVQLSLNDILLQPNQQSKLLYFPTEGIVSLISEVDDSSTTEIGLIGREGMVGTLPFLGKGVSNSQSIVQSPGWAMQVELDALQTECDRHELMPNIACRLCFKTVQPG